MIPVFLLRVFKPLLPYLIAVVAVVAVLSYVTMLRRDLAAEHGKNIALTLDNQADVAAIAAYKAQAAKWSTALAALDARTLGRSTSIARITDRIGAAPSGDDAPVAPVLAQALDSLRALQGGAP